MAQERFDTNEAEAVLMEAARRQARALGNSTSVSRERLEAMAAELDIAPETLHEVLADREAGATEAQLRAAYIAERRGTILPHLVPYVSVCLMLFVIWLLTTPGGHPWFIYPFMGWGIGMASHIAAVYPTSGAMFEAGFEEYKKQVERREREKAKRTAKRTEKEVVKERKAEPVASSEDVPTRSAESWNTVEEPKKQVLRAGRKG